MPLRDTQRGRGGVAARGCVISILTYQLYSQSLVWPVDPYYEELGSFSGDRGDLMEQVRAWARTTGEEQVAAGAGVDAYRGPGVLTGFDDNDTPTEITSQIRDVYVCARTIDQPEGVVSIYELPARRDDAAPGARTAFQALSTDNATGNPDWITDLGYHEVSAPFITTTGEVSRGISRSMLSIFPQVFHCLDEVVGASRSTPPDNIYVTGHSLGGALAQHFVSALLLGDQYGPTGDQMPASLSSASRISRSCPACSTPAGPRPIAC